MHCKPIFSSETVKGRAYVYAFKCKRNFQKRFQPQWNVFKAYYGFISCPPQPSHCYRAPTHTKPSCYAGYLQIISEWTAKTKIFENASVTVTEHIARLGYSGHALQFRSQNPDEQPLTKSLRALVSRLHILCRERFRKVAFPLPTRKRGNRFENVTCGRKLFENGEKRLRFQTKMDTCGQDLRQCII